MHQQYTCTCRTCGKSFRVPLYRLATAVYCSPACRGRVANASYVIRFWSRVDKNGTIPTQYPELGPCWIWNKATSKFGYGLAYTESGQHTNAHRAAWIITNGDVPNDLFVLHRCDNPPCVNPDHLFLGTQADNMADKVAKGRQASGDRNGSRLHPERRATGERHGSHTHPERWKRRHERTDPSN